MVFIDFALDTRRRVAEVFESADFIDDQFTKSKVMHVRTNCLNSNYKIFAKAYNECHHCANLLFTHCAPIGPLKDHEAVDRPSFDKRGDDIADVHAMGLGSIQAITRRWHVQLIAQ
jgi:hypothetical protein